MTSRIVRASLTTAMMIAMGSMASIAEAQAQPSPEHKKLAFFVGKWQAEVEVKPTPSSPGGKATGTESCDWFATLHVVCQTETAGAAGTYRGMRILSYIPLLKQYAQYSVDSLGYAILAMGQAQGDTWTFITDLGTAKVRNTMKTSNGSYTTVSEYAGADGKYVTTATSKSTRAK